MYMVTTEDSTPTMRDLNRYVTKTYADDWRDIGIELELKLQALKIIAKDNNHDCVHCFQSILDQWLNSTPNATWKMLEVAITNVRRAKLGLDPVTDVYSEYSYTFSDMYSCHILYRYMKNHA